MSRRQNPPMPAVDFGLLLVEGGDEGAIAQILTASVRRPAGGVSWRC
jgi:hypothetical protein